MTSSRRQPTATPKSSDPYADGLQPSGDRSGGDIGEAPGSPSYFGSTDQADPPSETTDPNAGPGEPPGSPAYYGQDATSEQNAGGELGEPDQLLPTVGEPPGSATYHGGS